MATAVLTSQPNPGFKYTEKIQVNVILYLQLRNVSRNLHLAGKDVACSLIHIPRVRD